MEEKNGIWTDLYHGREIKKRADALFLWVKI
jgi:hypothetical protein